MYYKFGNRQRPSRRGWLLALVLWETEKGTEIDRQTDRQGQCVALSYWTSKRRFRNCQTADSNDLFTVWVQREIRRTASYCFCLLAVYSYWIQIIESDMASSSVSKLFCLPCSQFSVGKQHCEVHMRGDLVATWGDLVVEEQIKAKKIWSTYA